MKTVNKIGLLILMFLIVGCENGQPAFSEEQRIEIRKNAGKLAENRHSFFVECMGLAAKMPRQSDDDVHKIINECDSTANYMANSFSQGR